MIYSYFTHIPHSIKHFYRYDCIKSNLYSVLLSYEKSVKVLAQKRFLSLGIIGAPFSKGQIKDGLELGPNAIRSAGLMGELKLLGHDVIDFGDYNNNINAINRIIDLDKKLSNDKLKNEYMVREMCLQLMPLIKHVVQSERIPITLGGDHSISIGSICGNASAESEADRDRDLCVIWIDAHADINTVKTTKSGNFHGMPVSFLLKQVEQILENPNKNCLPIKPCISSNNFAFIGLRDVESLEMDIIKKLKITHFSMKDIDKFGIFEVIARTLDKINPNLKRKIHISFDIDAVDQMLAPSTGTPVPAGLTFREALCIGEEIANTNLLCGLDLVELNPLIGSQNDANQTVNCALNIILSFFGKSRDLYAKNLK